MYRFNCWNVSLSPAIATLVTGNCLGLKYNLSPDSPSLLQTSINYANTNEPIRLYFCLYLLIFFCSSCFLHRSSCSSFISLPIFACISLLCYRIFFDLLCSLLFASVTSRLTYSTGLKGGGRHTNWPLLNFFFLWYSTYSSISLSIRPLIFFIFRKTLSTAVWNRNQKGIYSQQKRTQTRGYSMYIFRHWHVNMGSSSLQSRQLGRKLYKQWRAEKVFDKKDRKDVNRKSPCNDVTKQWLNLDSRGVIRIADRTKADTRYASRVGRRVIADKSDDIQ